VAAGDPWSDRCSQEGQCSTLLDRSRLSLKNARSLGRDCDRSFCHGRTGREKGSEHGEVFAGRPGSGDRE
jgi:hypothetical protein